MDPHLPGTVPFTGVGCRPAPRAGSLDARIFGKTKVCQGIRVTFFIDKKVTMLRPARPHPCATAQQPNLVALKTRLIYRSIALFPGLLSRLFVFHVLFLVIVFHNESCHYMKQVLLAAQTI